MSRRDPSAAIAAVHNIGAEQALLGCVLRRDSAYFDIHNDINSPDFYDPRHRLIWETITKIASAKKGRFNADTVSDFLSRDTEAGNAVSRDYLEALIDAVADPSALRGYVESVVDLSRTRRMIAALREAERSLISRDPDMPLADVVEAINSNILDAGRLDRTTQRTLASYAEEVYIKLDALGSGKAKGDTFRWGLQAMDNACGPAIPGNFHVIGGRAEMGKTALALGVAMALAKQAPGAIIEMDMRGDTVAERAVSRITQIPANRITRGEVYDSGSMSKFADALYELHGLPIYLVAKPGLTREQIRAHCIGLSRRHGCRWFITDHLQIIGPSYRRQDDADIISHACKDQVILAKELNAVMIALSQLNSQGRDRDHDRPRPRDLMYYNSIEPHADLIVFPYRPEVAIRERQPPEGPIGDQKTDAAMQAWHQKLDAARNRAEIIVGKNRHGPSGISEHCDWNGPLMRFEALSWDREQARKLEAANKGAW
jgi:replicative DNA helicase